MGRRAHRLGNPTVVHSCVMIIHSGLQYLRHKTATVLPSPLPGGMLRWRALSHDACDARDFGAVGDNVTDDTLAVQRAIDECHSLRRPHNDVAVMFAEGKTFRVHSSIALVSNITLLLGVNTSLFSAFTPGDPIKQNPRCPTLYWPHGPTAVLCGTNLTNVAILGAGEEGSSVLDGGGWPWYLAAVANKTLWGQGPRLFELAWSENVTLSRITFVNSPSWTVHPTFCRGVLAEHLRIINPRFTPNTDGFDPDSSVDVVLRDSLIDTGDDGISVKSSNSSVAGSQHLPMPARRIHIYRVRVLSRNVCVGSATFGGVYDLLMEDSEIGDDHGSSPWAIKYKSHQQYPGEMVNHTFRRLRVGNIQPNTYQQPHAGYFMSIELRYHPLLPNRTCHDWDCPRLRDVSFEDIRITGAARAGDLSGLKGDLLQGLTFSNVSFATLPPVGWSCSYVNLSSFKSTGVSPPLSCSSGPTGLPSWRKMP
jgi:hypothetical protein